MNALGRHILVEYYNCSSEILNDVTIIENSMVEAAKAADATVINSSFHHFSPYGVSGVVVIQESHLAIHTWPEYGYAAVDLFTCGDEINPWICFEYLKKAFKSETHSAMEINRGQLELLEKKAFNIQGTRDITAPELKIARNVWLTDKNDSIASSFRHTGEILFREKTPFQTVEVLDTYAYGKMLVIDKMVMTSEKDEFVYHEMITHPAMLLHKNPKNILVIGAGDGGTIKELFKHSSIEKITMVEIDEAVVNASKAHFPEISKEFANPKLELIIGDGIQFVKDAKDKTYDIVIIDSSDPVGPAEGLFSETFFANVYRILKQDGIMAAQSESPRFNEQACQELFEVYDKVFGTENVHPYLAYIPTYPSGQWAFAFCSKSGIHPSKDFNDSLGNLKDLKYYNEALHYGAFALPNFVKELLGK
ncbi:MAG: polyamine aminopropyltransferase [Chitinophagales bacterium]